MECGDVFNSSVGWISSLDRDGDGLYDCNEDCMWIIKAPDFFGIQLTIIYLEIEPNVLCSYDYLKVVKQIFNNHTGKCIRRIGGIYAYCRYFIDRKW